MKNLALILISLLVLAGCTEKPLDPNKPVYVKISTNMGDVTVLLYDDTPLHRDNYIRLCQENQYENVLFHRIISGFVVQGGDPKSKEQVPGERYGSGNGGYTTPAEIQPHYFNKRGALIDAKRGDNDNPQRASAGTHFCFIQGRVMTDEELDATEERINSIHRNWLFYKYMDDLKNEDPSWADEAKQEELEEMAMIMAAETMEEIGYITIPEDRREVYKTLGGAPHLDGSVTIFGEVVEGLDIVEQMSLVETDEYDRPLNDVIIKSTKVFQK